MCVCVCVCVVCVYVDNFNINHAASMRVPFCERQSVMASRQTSSGLQRTAILGVHMYMNFNLSSLQRTAILQCAYAYGFKPPLTSPPPFLLGGGRERGWDADAYNFGAACCI